MRKCSHDCPAICDYCIWFDFNGDDFGAYTDDGYCRVNGENKWPEDECENFVCFNIAEARIGNQS